MSINLKNSNTQRLNFKELNSFFKNKLETSSQLILETGNFGSGITIVPKPLVENNLIVDGSDIGVGNRPWNYNFISNLSSDFYENYCKNNIHGYKYRRSFRNTELDAMHFAHDDGPRTFIRLEQDLSMKAMFKDMAMLEEVSGFPGFYTGEDQDNERGKLDCTSMFEGCSALKTVDFSTSGQAHFINTPAPAVTPNINHFPIYTAVNMFKDCTSLTDIHFGIPITRLINFYEIDSKTDEDLEKIFGGMFENCTSLKHLKVMAMVGFNTPTVIDKDRLGMNGITPERINRFRKIAKIPDSTELILMMGGGYN